MPRSCVSQFQHDPRRHPNGTPAHDHLGDIFATLDAEAFQRCFVAWTAALTKAPADVIAIDGKTSRRSGAKKSSKLPIHMVSAFAARQRLVLGQVAVAEKSNEIVAIPALLAASAEDGARRRPGGSKAPTDKMIAYAQSLARANKTKLPEGYQRDFDAFRRFLDEHAR